MAEFDPDLIKQFLGNINPKDRTYLLPSLHAAQEFYGHIPENIASLIAKDLGIPLSDVFGVIDFYSLFHTTPVAKTVIHVCNDPACSMAGSESVLKFISEKVVFYDEFKRNPNITVEVAPCLGLCEHAPATLVQGKAVKGKDLSTWENIFSPKTNRPETLVGGDIRILTKNCGRGESTKLNHYVENGGYNALKTVLQNSKEFLIEQIKLSGLVGRGGAAFPTGIKWDAAAKEEDSPKYVVCNGDEAEPGTFKDRILMEDDPHLIVEGLIISGYAIGASKGYFYIRGEYLNAYEQVITAVQDAKNAGFLGNNILDSKFSFEIEVRRGAGAYVCGEETALFESIEGKRGFPRVKPPFPIKSGLFGKPTVINNVETLANIPLIINWGPEKYREIGTQNSPGPKLFCLSGDINKPGLYEVPFGVTLNYVINTLAGGMRDNIPFQSALIGGAAGAFAFRDQLDTKLTFEDLRSAGLPLGSGVITVFNENRDLIEIAHKLAIFFAEESCGKCFPCQIGTQRQLEILKRIKKGDIDSFDQDRLLDIITTMTDTSLCGLGQTAGSAIKSLIVKKPEKFTFHTSTNV